MANAGGERSANQSAHATNVASPSCRKSATSFRDRYNPFFHYSLAEKRRDMLAAIDDLDRAADRTHHFLGRVNFERMAQGSEQIGYGHGMILDVRAVGV